MKMPWFVVATLVVSGCGGTKPKPPTPSPTPSASSSAPTTATPTSAIPTTSLLPADTYYQDCEEVKAAGKAPLHLGEPGYRKGLDRDGDGKACDK